MTKQTTPHPRMASRVEKERRQPGSPDKAGRGNGGSRFDGNSPLVSKGLALPLQSLRWPEVVRSAARVLLHGVLFALAVGGVAGSTGAPLANAVEEGSRHWAFQPLRDDGEANVDDLIVRSLAADGLERSPRARPDRLLRRVHLLLTGLPPTPREMALFRADPSPESFEKVVDDLLARPGFGERWGRHWLDVAGYADSSGLHEDHDRPHAWRYVTT